MQEFNDHRVRLERLLRRLRIDFETVPRDQSLEGYRAVRAKLFREIQCVERDLELCNLRSSHAPPKQITSPDDRQPPLSRPMQQDTSGSCNRQPVARGEARPRREIAGYAFRDDGFSHTVYKDELPGFAEHAWQQQRRQSRNPTINDGGDGSGGINPQKRRTGSGRSAGTGKQSTYASTSAKDRSSGLGGMVQCSACSAFVKQKNLDRHLRKMHKSRTGQEDVSKSTASRAKRPGPILWKGASARQPYNADEALGNRDTRDASTGVGNMFREHGRFGSYPVHDNYGEESGPS